VKIQLIIDSAIYKVEHVFNRVRDLYSKLPLFAKIFIAGLPFILVLSVFETIQLHNIGSIDQ